jgi:transcriptional regulator with PAS, ATPase and Fis domain
MRGIDNTPGIDLPDLVHDQLCHVLICAGQAIPNPGNDGIRIVEIGTALELGRGTDAALVPRFATADPMMSRSHAVIRRLDAGTVVLRDLGSRNGTFVNGEHVRDERPLADGAVIFMGAHVFVYRRTSREDLEAVRLEMGRPFCPVPTMSPAIARLTRRLRQLARSDVEILLGGETGVGKEVFANAVHRESGRHGAMVAINCAALPDTLIESELFGYARGAHSMAEHGKPGLLERAENGTLFLDEIGEMPVGAQSKLLRFLQDRELWSLGATKPRKLDVRVVAASHRVVSPSDDFQGIRLDLAARLGSERFVIPPLRDRPEDIGLFVRYFLRDPPRTFDIWAYQALFLHRWPGNVRELEKVLRNASILASGNRPIGLGDLPIDSADLTPDRRAGGDAARASGKPITEGPSTPLPGWASTFAGAEPARAPAPGASASAMPPGRTQPAMVAVRSPSSERPTPEELTILLERHRGNVGHVARELGRQRTLVWRWLRRAGIDPARYRNAG